MTIETKYDIEKSAFVYEDGEWWKGVIMGWSHNGTDLLYEVYVAEIYRWFRIPEQDIIIDEPQGFNNTTDFLNLFPEFDDYEKNELSLLVRKLRKQSAERIKKSK